MRWFLTLVLGLVALAAVASVAYGHDPNNGATVSVSPQVGGSSPLQPSTSADDTDGIRLTLSLNSTSLSQGQSISISLVGYNTLSQSNYVNESADWGNPNVSDGPCGTGNQPIGYAILSGYYTTANATSSDTLSLYAPGFYSCPLVLAEVRGYDFLAANSTAEIYAACTPEPCAQIETDVTGTFGGYWTSTQPGSAMQSFLPGVYTVVGADEWGDLVLLHFTVTR